MRISLLLAAGTLLLTANESPAQPGPGMGGGRGQGAMMANADLDGDGMVSAAEHRNWAEKVFAAMDSNTDGKLSRQEYLAVHMGPAPGAGGNPARMQAARQQADARKGERFSAMDGNKDGFVTRPEFLADADRNFAAKDRNKDGRLSAGEFRTWRNQQ